MNRIGIFGAGGFAREVAWLIEDMGLAVAAFFESDAVWNARDVAGLPVLPASRFDASSWDAVIAIGNPATRRAVRDGLPRETHYPTLVHPNVARSRRVEIGAGSIVCAGSVLTCDIVLGEHVHLNLLTTVGHDCRLDDFVTTAPAVNISGNCHLGAGSYFGTNACLREGVHVAPGATVGMGAVVVASLPDVAVYVGNPARKRGA